MLKIRIICIGLCITEDKVVQNVHIDLNIKEEYINQINTSQEHIQEEQQAAKTDQIKENKPDEMKQEVMEQTKSKYSFIQKFISIIILIFLICLFIFAISQIKKMREQKEKALLVEFLKQEQIYKTATKSKEKLKVNFNDIKLEGKTQVKDLSFCKKNKENFLVVTKDEANYFVYIFYPNKAEMILIDSKNYHQYEIKGDLYLCLLTENRLIPEEEILIFGVFNNKKTKDMFEDIVDGVLTIQDFFLQKTEVFVNSIQEINRRFKIEQTHSVSVKTKYSFLDFFFIFLDLLGEEKFLKTHDFCLGLSDDLSLIFYDPKKQTQLINEKNFLQISKDLNKKILFYFTEIDVSGIIAMPQVYIYMYTFFKGEIYNVCANKIDEKKFEGFFAKVKQRTSFFKQKQKKKIENFLTKNKKLFDEALEKCKAGASEAKIMSISDFLEIFLTDKDVK